MFPRQDVASNGGPITTIGGSIRQVPGVGPVKVEKYADVFCLSFVIIAKNSGRNFYVTKAGKIGFWFIRQDLISA